jgi:hypothetical protein
MRENLSLGSSKPRLANGEESVSKVGIIYAAIRDLGDSREPLSS